LKCLVPGVLWEWTSRQRI